MTAVGTLGSEMQDICRICVLSTHPVRNILPKSATHLRFIAGLVGFAQLCQPFLRPITHWQHNCFLKHLELLLFGKMKTAFPSISEAVRPFAWVAVSFVPYVFLRPQ